MRNCKLLSLPLSCTGCKLYWLDDVKVGVLLGVPWGYYTPVHLVESVENYALCMRRCLLCSSSMSVSIAHLLLTQIVLTPAQSIKLCAIASYCLFHSHAQVVSFTDSMMWIGVYAAIACAVASQPSATVASEYSHSTLNSTATCSSHSGTV